MKHWILTILLATFLLGNIGCMEAESVGSTDIRAREHIYQNYGEIQRNKRLLKELRDRSMTANKDARDSMGIEIRPVPVPLLPKAFPPRFPPTRINKSKKFTLLWPVPEPSPYPPPEPIACVLAEKFIVAPSENNEVVEFYSRELRFDEQHISGGCAVITLTERQAIDYVRTMPIYKALSDEAALDHFIVIHYAWYVDSET